MTSAATPHNEWVALGERLAPSFNGVHAAVVAASDPVAAAQVALAVARIQGATRRVAIADLVGEVEPLQSLIEGDDPHGVSDSFLYGVSLNKIARPIDGTGSVFLMPSGTEAVANEHVYANERWRRLAAGFHQVGALLLIVALPGTPGFADLCGYVGALLPVGEYRYPTPRGIPLIAPAIIAPLPELKGSGESAAISPDELDAREREKRALDAAAQDSAARQRRMVGMVALALAFLLALYTMWPRVAAMLPAPAAGMFDAAPADTVGADPLLRVEAPVDRGAPDETSGSAGVLPAEVTPALPPALLAVANPGDSARAARFSIYFTSANTREAALPDDRIRALPSVAMTPVMDAGEQWYRLTIGAYTDRSEADALLRRMRDEKLIGSGSIVRVPYALRLEEEVAGDVAQARIVAYARRGILAYALRQADGLATIYTGAFETPRQATLLADSLRTTGIEPVLVLRTGRAF